MGGAAACASACSAIIVMYSVYSCSRPGMGDSAPKAIGGWAEGTAAAGGACACTGEPPAGATPRGRLKSALGSSYDGASYKPVAALSDEPVEVSTPRLAGSYTAATRLTRAMPGPPA